MQADPGWVGPTMALAMIIIAASSVTIAAIVVITAAESARQVRRLGEAVEGLREEIAPTLKAVHSIVEEGREATGVITHEAHELADASRRLRQGLGERLANLEALYDVLEEELEETALDVATTLRTLRTGAGWFARLRRFLLRGRR